ncbi:Multidrug resistance protein Stp [Aquicella siphonis]|uniref:Multidrug resistance protein Stp n=1 Tax=Aquicella siphonis TaxID=254247 RepID=A0A5E4PJ46_9COXI|nr:MFS transporter [Aquicella siphonis]VVC76402.1 Multidrug resistance protein Stp [Aquicella siphonis]
MQTHDFPNKWWALIGLSLLSFTAFLDYTIVSTALPFIQKELNATVLQLQWVMNIFGMVLCMFMIVAGQAGDLFGRERIFIFGFILFGIAAMGSALAGSIEWLIFFRAIQGFAGAIIFTIGVSLLPQAFPANEQTRAIGIFSAFNGAGLAIGPFLGGILITLFNWRWIFWVNIPIIIAGLLSCIFALKPAPPSTEKIKIDWMGLFLLMIGLGALVYGIIHGEQAGWDAPATWITISTGGAALLLLYFIEQKVTHPLLDFSLIRNSHAMLAMLVCIAAGFITSVFMFFDPLYLKLIRKFDALIVGITLLAIPLTQVVISLFFERLVKHFGVFHLILIALAAAIITSVCHALFTISGTIIFVLFAFIIMGYTWGVANVGSITAIMQSVKPEKIGNAIGTVFTFWNLSGSIFLALASVLFHWRESTIMHSVLMEREIVLSPDQHQQIHLLLSEPEEAKQLLAASFGKQASVIFDIFQDSFMSGFHWAAWFGAILMLAVFLAGWILSRR